MVSELPVDFGVVFRVLGLSLLLLSGAPGQWQFANARSIGAESLDQCRAELSSSKVRISELEGEITKLKALTGQDEQMTDQLATEENNMANGMWPDGTEQYTPVDKEDELWRAAVGKIRVVEGKLSFFEPATKDYKQYCVLVPNDRDELQYAQFKDYIGTTDEQCGEKTRFTLERYNDWRWKIRSGDGRLGHVGNGHDMWWRDDGPYSTFGVMHRNNGSEIALWSPDDNCVFKHEKNNWSSCRRYNKNAVDEYRFWFSAWKQGSTDNWTPELTYRTVWQIDGCMVAEDSSMTVKKTLKVGKIVSKDQTHTASTSGGVEAGFFSATFSYEGSVSLGESFEEEQTIEIPGEVAPGQILKVQQLMGEWGPTQLRTSSIRYTCTSCDGSGKEEKCSDGYDDIHVTTAGEAAHDTVVAAIVPTLANH